MLYKRKDSPYWWVRFTPPGGTPIRISTQTADRKQAAQFEAKIRAESWERAKLGTKPRVPWQSAVARFIAEKQSGQGRPWADLAYKLRNLDACFRGVYLDEIDEAKLADYMAHRRAGGVGNATINRDLEVVRAILRKAQREWKVLSEVPVVLKLAEPRRRVRFLTRSEADTLLGVLPPYLRVLVAFSLATGLRKSNVLHLEWSQVDLERRVCWIHADQHKTRKPLAVPLNGDALALLRGEVGRHPVWVFTHKGDTVGRPDASAWETALGRAGIENFRWHDLRHTWASWHVQSGTPLHVLQELGGWSTPAMVQRYAHLSAAHLATYAENVAGPRLVSTERKVV